MYSLIESRGRLIAAMVLAAGSLFGACTDETTPEQGTSPICTVNCGPGTPTGGGTGGALAGGPAGGTTGTGALAGGIAAGGTTGTGVPGGTPGGAPAGTAGGTAGGAAGGGAGVPCAVQSIVQAKCGSCHGATPVSGPMPLVTQAHWQAMSTVDRTKKYYELAKVRINASGPTAMPPPSIGTLTAEEKTTLNNWLNAGAPASNESCSGGTAGGGGPGGPGGDPNNPDTTGLECYKMLAHAQGSKTAKYKVGAATDKYMNFGFRAPWTGTVYGIVVKPVIDNAKALHHWLLYREQVADGSVTETIGQHAGGELIHGWAPGGIPMDFRTHGSVGFELPATSYSVEIHYNSSDPAAEDASGVELCVSKTKPQNVASQSWLGYDQGGTISYATGICLEPATSWTGTCRPVNHRAPINLLFMTPHLHQTGRHLKAVINGPNGSRVLHDKAFDFAYQVTYPTKEVLMPGESITTTCTFSAPNCAGQATSQEMCYLFTYYYPAGALVDNGPEGTLMHGEGVCLGQ